MAIMLHLILNIKPQFVLVNVDGEVSNEIILIGQDVDLYRMLQRGLKSYLSYQRGSLVVTIYCKSLAKFCNIGVNNPEQHF